MFPFPLVQECQCFLIRKIVEVLITLRDSLVQDGFLKDDNLVCFSTQHGLSTSSLNLCVYDNPTCFPISAELNGCEYGGSCRDAVICDNDGLAFHLRKGFAVPEFFNSSFDLRFLFRDHLIHFFFRHCVPCPVRNVYAAIFCNGPKSCFGVLRISKFSRNYRTEFSIEVFGNVVRDLYATAWDTYHDHILVAVLLKCLRQLFSCIFSIDKHGFWISAFRDCFHMLR